MTDDLAIHVIINTDKLDKIIESKTKIKSLELDNDLFLVSFHEIDKEKFIEEHTNFYISIGVVSAITAYSRMQRTQFKNFLDNKMYYTDTDSAVMEKP
jgi:hypothetical protein